MPYADFGKRVLAYLIDSAIFLVGYIALLIIATIAGAIATGLGVLVWLLGGLALIAASLAVFIMGNGGALGQTPGKHLIGIKVVGPAPGPIGYSQGFIRYLGYVLNSFCCLGWFWPLFDDQNRGWQDMLADTRVVVAPPGEKDLNYWWNNFQL